MFSPLGLFKQTPCPDYPHCSLTPCLFSHDRWTEPHNDDVTQRKTSVAHSLGEEEKTDEVDGPRKRRRVGVDSTDHHVVDKATDQTSGARSPPLASRLSANSARKTSKAQFDALPRTASRTISPPPLRGGIRASITRIAPTRETSQTKTPVLHSNVSVSDPSLATRKAHLPKVKALEESLNPRILSNPPASHAIRLKLLTMLHEEMTRLNNEVKKSVDASKEALTLSDSELIAQALDEEFQFARGSPAIYQNLIKSRIMVLRKMKLTIWEEERIKKIAERLPKDTPKGPSSLKPIVTDMTPAEEIAFVSRLAAQQDGLNKHGYVTTMPSETELEKARKGVESAQGWEQCDRCTTRFQVFPGRREEDGALTSGGTCTYHWAKPRRPDMAKGENRSRDMKYACCDETVGTSTGCTKADSHVFKTSDPKRLALVMPFETTPVSNRNDTPGAVCFDCEMGYSTLGMELIRLTATAWPDGKEVLDVLVRPLGEVLDLNSRFSGVWPEDYANAIPYFQAPQQEQVAADDGTPRLQIVESPLKARELLFQLLRLETPLIGHALENDLNAARILHPTIVDTALLFPHHRGLPLRFGLKMLMKKHLGRDIQMGGDKGHDSKEDARAAGDLVRLRVGDMWRKMRAEGWTKRGGEFFPPSSLTPCRPW
ncbi:MAG: hypothetical protein Q9221_002606 [Calogaya cf. arnoldii]